MTRHPSANRTQRERRARHPRIDYYPSTEALAAIEGVRGFARTGTNSAVLNAIVEAWAETQGAQTGIFRRKCARANNSAPRIEALGKQARLANELKSPPIRVTCGAARRRDGQPCEALSVPGKRRCRFHGGMSTGPRTEEGKQRVTRNLPHRRGPNDAN
ncbi:HGGxSTG domain-containing protein [Luteimonas cellulosilyticus]|uniref:HGGxSTG domain-containing protein n=1 Tax=Luteimonas cellulosilyticus TaxID=2683586 RepID=UPI003CCD1D6F